MATTVELFKAKRAAIYALYDDEVGRLMDRKTVKTTLEYWDDFYDAIKTPKDVESNVMRTCTAGN
jgi:hypothetical protein